MEKRLYLAGNPNSGKSTLFNRLCGAHRRTGNFAGVSVDSGEGHFSHGGVSYTLIDLPGAYSLDAMSADEQVSADILHSADGCIVQIIDAGAIERSLHLTKELLQLGKPLVVALNMADEIQRRGVTIDTEKLSQMLGAPVCAISALHGRGIGALLDAVTAAIVPPPCRFTAEDLARATVQRQDKETLSDKIDRAVLCPALGYPLCALLLFCIFGTVFGSFGNALRDGFSAVLASLVTLPLQALLTRCGVHPLLRAYLSDGALAGVCSVLSFLPQIALLFLCLALLEDIGVMARIAFLFDPLLRRFGLDGKAMLPLAVSFGCTVPAVLAARVTDAPTRRKLCFVLPFISCPARAPVYALFIGAFFGGHGATLLLCLYLGGLCAALVGAKLLSAADRGKRPLPFVMELPPYRLPSPHTLALSVFDRCRDFAVKAGTVIFLSASIVWALEHFGTGGIALRAEDSFLHAIGQVTAPLFAPLGFGNAIAATALLMGFFAKESIVSTLTVLCGTASVTEMLGTLFTPASALSFMVFSLLYTPCLATLAAIRRESGSARTAAKVCLFNFAVAYAVAFAVYRIAGMAQ